MHIALRLLALALPLSACADPSLATTDQEIIGGTITPAGMHPAVGSLVMEVDGEFYLGCTGTLIAPDVVLTAGHCLTDLDGITLSFTLSHDATTQPTVVPLRAMIPHEDFVDEEPTDFLADFHDIGLVMLAQPIRDVTPVELIRADQSARLVPELALEIVGYGRSNPDDADDDSPAGAGVKRHATTALIQLNEAEMQVSRGQGEPQNCSGDSGGPSFADFGDGLQLVSVVSRSYATDTCSTGGIHTRVDVYLDWIAATIAADAAARDDDGGCSAASGHGAGAALVTLLMACLLGAPRRSRR